jgi:hypothetical protein
MKAIFFLLFLTLSIPLFAQSNVPPISVGQAMALSSNQAAAEEPITVSNANQALGAFIHYKDPSISFDGAVKIVGELAVLVLIGAKYLRKIIPDSWQVNQGGVLLSHLAGEVNPTVAKLALASAQEAAVKANPTASESKVVPPQPMGAPPVAATPNPTKT